MAEERIRGEGGKVGQNKDTLAKGFRFLSCN